MPTLYIQQPDFSIKEIGSVSLKNALKILRESLLELDESVQYGWDQAEPMIGFKKSNTAFIEVNKDGDQSYLIRFENPLLEEPMSRKNWFSRTPDRYYIMVKVWQSIDVETAIGLFSLVKTSR